jgi:fucose 4-O-acetylase-like acetyltransferase
MTRAPATKIRTLAARIDAATPAHRDRTVDALRALAICGVILGHWLVTALVLTPGGTLRDASPLASIPALTPASWIFQTLAVFFCVGGYASARSYRGGYLAWLRQRLVRLSRPVAALAAVWVVIGTGMWLAGASGSTLHTVLTLVLDPLWFLGVYAGLTALTPVAVTLVRRLGAAAALIPLAVVAAVDAVRLGLGGPSWVGWINVVAGWLVPYLLGIAWARGAFASRKLPALMLAGGVAATIALIVWARYPASMVGVNGARISNLNPPSLAVVTFGIAQVGLALLLRGPLARLMRKPVAWAAVAMANLSAMTLFLWHQTAFLAVTAAGLLVGRLPGLHTAPTSAVWVGERIAWLPVFAMVLAVLVMVFRRAERAPRGPDRAPRQQPDRAPRRPGRAPRRPGRALRRPGRAPRQQDWAPRQQDRAPWHPRYAGRRQATREPASAAAASTSIRREVAGGSGGSP